MERAQEANHLTRHRTARDQPNRRAEQILPVGGDSGVAPHTALTVGEGMVHPSAYAHNHHAVVASATLRAIAPLPLNTRMPRGMRYWRTTSCDSMNLTEPAAWAMSPELTGVV